MDGLVFPLNMLGHPKLIVEKETLSPNNFSMHIYIYIYVLCTHYMVVTLCFFLHTFPWNNGLTSGTSPSRSEVSQQQTRLFCPKSGAL